MAPDRPPLQLPIHDQDKTEEKPEQEDLHLKPQQDILCLAVEKQEIELQRSREQNVTEGGIINKQVKIMVSPQLTQSLP